MTPKSSAQGSEELKPTSGSSALELSTIVEAYAKAVGFAPANMPYWIHAFADNLLAAAGAQAPEQPCCQACGDGITAHDPGVCGNCFAMKYRATAPTAQGGAQDRDAEPRPLDEYHEDYGNVVWWCWEDGEWLGEPAWIGTPNDSDWPDYHTHWTPHPKFPAALSQQPASGDTK
ncbi:hypothetical protein [Paraburkholderia sp. BL6669N2]|uniref:hypothetical protein n=1 Tax=Paraburkholderia sp. BL6669N2 TaxID=1938807 RepID=UPI000E26BB52|nr:hypothetical protein [Paraburkholderia sp. BL6669N2]